MKETLYLQSVLQNEKSLGIKDLNPNGFKYLTTHIK